MNDRTTPEDAFGAMFSAWRNLVDAQVTLGTQMVRSFTGVTLPSTGDVVRTLRGRASGCCHVPPPCWMPQPLGDCISHVGQCKTACVRVVITNVDRVGRTITVDSSNKTVTVSPGSLTLGPLERGTISVCVDIPQDTAAGTRIETVIRIHGCKESYLRWTVSVGTLGLDACHEITVDDGPDHVHHWYDHFYCVRGCRDQRTPQPAGANG
jgi:hypothetical protein